MLTTRQPVLRRFWYATEKLDALVDGPKPFTLMGEKLVPVPRSTRASPPP